MNEPTTPELTGAAATRAAIAELEAGEGARFDTVEDLMAELTDSAPDRGAAPSAPA